MVELEVTNTGDRAGSEVVQCYVGPPPGSVTRPPKELKAFTKVHLAAGATATVQLALDARAFAYWRPAADVPTTAWVEPSTEALAVPPAPPAGWTTEPGRYVLHIGRSSAAIDHVVEIELPG
jgi:beta-glucosidase